MAEPSPAEWSAFVARFRPDTFPFCPAGLRLLYALDQHRPDLYEAARQYAFAHFDDPIYQTSPDGRALMAHVAGCAECQAC